MKDLAIFMPARLQSERLPNKLLRGINNTDLCLWEIACERLSLIPGPYHKYALVFDQALIDIANKYNLTVIIRDPKTCTVDGPLNYIFKEIETMDADYLMFLNPCLPLLGVDTLVGAIDQFVHSDKDYGTSVKQYKNWLFLDDGRYQAPITAINYERLSTKEIPNYYYEAAHCFHIFPKVEFLDNGNMLSNNLELLEIPCDETVDVDTEQDFQVMEVLYAVHSGNRD